MSSPPERPTKQDCGRAVFDFWEARDEWHQEFSARPRASRRMLAAVRVLVAGGYLGPGEPMPKPDTFDDLNPSDNPDSLRRRRVEPDTWAAGEHDPC